MNMIQLGVFSASMCFSLVVCSLASGNHPEAVMKQKGAVDSLKSPEMKQLLQKILATVEAAQQEKKDFQAKVARGDVLIVNNNGVWCAVLDENKAVTKLANYTSTDGPMTYFMKVVYTDKNHKARLNEQSYHLNMFTNGMLKGYMRADMQEMTEYHPDG